MLRWLKSLLDRNSIAQARKRRASHATVVLRQEDDATYHSNADILDGLEFACTLQLRTPLTVLVHHGDRFDGPPSQAPRYGDPMHGIWTYRTKSWAGLGIGASELPETVHASDIGPVRPSEYLFFLIDFRKIVESDLAHDAQVAGIKRLRAKHELAYGRVVEANPGFPDSFFARRLANIPGIGPKLAEVLYARGFRSQLEILSASDQQLLDIPGIGRGTLRKIRGA